LIDDDIHTFTEDNHMRITKTRYLAVPIAVTTLIVGACSLVPCNPPSIPLDDYRLSTIRGVDKDFFRTGTASCDALGVQALQQLYGGGWNQQSGCGGMNLGFNCGGCTKTLSRPVGIQWSILLNGGGQMNNDVGPCGFVQGGTCGFTNPNTTPPTYGCLGVSVAINPSTGQPYSCSDLVAITNQ
jgi:hypothetical protein